MSEQDQSQVAPQASSNEPSQTQTPQAEPSRIPEPIVEAQTQQEAQASQMPEPSTPSHMMTYDITTKDGLVYPNRVGPGDTNDRGDIDARIEMTPTNGRVTIQTFDRYLERLREFREGKRAQRQARSQDIGHER